MKITKEVLADIEASVQSLDTPEKRDDYRNGRFPRADAVQDLDKRYRWDLLHASGYRVVDLYEQLGVNDTHIDTALRRIVPAL